MQPTSPDVPHHTPDSHATNEPNAQAKELQKAFADESAYFSQAIEKIVGGTASLEETFHLANKVGKQCDHLGAEEQIELTAEQTLENFEAWKNAIEANGNPSWITLMPPRENKTQMGTLPEELWETSGKITKDLRASPFSFGKKKKDKEDENSPLQKKSRRGPVRTPLRSMIRMLLLAAIFAALYVVLTKRGWISSLF